MTGAASPAAQQPYAPRWLLLTALSLSAFITGLDNTILNIALSALRHDFDLSYSGLQWVGTSYRHGDLHGGLGGRSVCAHR